MTDPIADYLTRLRNAVKAGHRVWHAPPSVMAEEMRKKENIKDGGWKTKNP